MRYLLILNILASILVISVQSSSLFQSSFSSSQQQLEDEMYNELNNLLGDPKNPDDAAKDCKSCISLLKMIKRFCYFPETIQLAVMTNVCKRSKQVDNQVVRYLFFFPCFPQFRSFIYVNSVKVWFENRDLSFVKF